MRRTGIIFTALWLSFTALAQSLTELPHSSTTLAQSPTTLALCYRDVDPRIGSVGVGRTFPGPSVPYGMVKPGPDCGVLPNAGWAPMPAAVSGFSQTHVSGTGGGQKYGNILILPHIEGRPGPAERRDETMELGYYATTFTDGIRTEITTGARCAFYRIHYPHGGRGARLLVDATHFLGKDTIPDLRERQQLVGAEVEAVGTHELRGFSRVRGGWNNGDAYTVYFALVADRPFALSADSDTQRATLVFADSLIHIKIGISYVSTQQARRNVAAHDFDTQLALTRGAWEAELSKVHVDATPAQRRMFYTALYHTMLMPVDKTGENPKWTDAPYYDDYYALWDTYRTSMPLIGLLSPEREAALINSLLNIYVREGYMPDARSGDCNGRTQGGSNGEAVIADAYLKHVAGIDYELALRAMVTDAELPPGGNEEKEGRGGLEAYKRLGYVPFGIARAGTRTVEYAFNDYCIAQVARGLGHNSLALRYERRARNWRHLWRADYEYDGMRGFIMPRSESGEWLDSVPWGRSQVFRPRVAYTPSTRVAPWYVPWWDTFFYEATSHEYSLFVPHDVPGLIEACGGADAFVSRLDRFFARGYYNVQNEPSFLTPMLYHWAGRPDLSSRRVRQIVEANYSDRADGLPGNDDSGAMSSWLAFHMMGLYPNAGTDYYLLHTPLLRACTVQLPNGRTLRISRRGTGDGYGRALLDGRLLADARITHAQLMQGGELVFETVDDSPADAALSSTATGMSPSDAALSPTATALSPTPAAAIPAGAACFDIHYTLNRQQRTWPLSLWWDGDTLTAVCKQTTYRLPREQAEQADGFCWLSPQADGTVYHDVRGSFAFLSARAMQQLERRGFFLYDGITWRPCGSTADGRRHFQADVDGTRLEALFHPGLDLWLVTALSRNPLGIDWRLSPRRHSD